MIPGSELFARVVDALTTWRRFYGFYLYEANQDVTPAVPVGTGPGDVPAPVGTASLTAVEAFDGLPAAILADQLFIPKAHGIPGTSSTIAPGTVVGVGFIGGNPARPFVGFYLPGQPTPLEVNINATTAIRFGNPLSQFAVSKSPIADANASALRTVVNLLVAKVNVLVPAAPITPVAPLADSGSARVSVE
jgi:hypothetical protein